MERLNSFRVKAAEAAKLTVETEFLPKLVTDNRSADTVLSGGEKRLRLRETLSPLVEEARLRRV